MGQPRKPSDNPPGQYAYEGLDRLMHERSRLSILSSLMGHPQGLLFNDLKELCSLTDGNLSRQIQILQEANLVEVWKSLKKGRPQTLCRLTDTGRERFTEYLHQLEKVIANASKSRPAGSSVGGSLKPSLG